VIKRPGTTHLFWSSVFGVLRRFFFRRGACPDPPPPSASLFDMALAIRAAGLLVPLVPQCFGEAGFSSPQVPMP